MPHPPYSLALFSLVLKPGNKQAEGIISNLDNSYLVSTVSNGKLALDVSFYICRKLSKTLAILGREVNTDIYIEGSSITKI
jgi:hypothetical protein